VILISVVAQDVDSSKRIGQHQPHGTAVLSAERDKRALNVVKVESSTEISEAHIVVGYS